MTETTIGTVAMGDSGEAATIRKHAEYAASEFFARVGEGEGEGDVVIDLIVQAVTAALSSRPAQEAVAWALKRDGVILFATTIKNLAQLGAENKAAGGGEVLPLYAAPQPVEAVGTISREDIARATSLQALEHAERRADGTVINGSIIYALQVMIGMMQSSAPQPATPSHGADTSATDTAPQGQTNGLYEAALDTIADLRAELAEYRSSAPNALPVTAGQGVTIILQRIAAEIQALKLHPATGQEYDAGYIAARNDAFAIVQEVIDNAD